MQGHRILKVIIVLGDGKAIESTPAQYHDIFISSIKDLNEGFYSKEVNSERINPNLNIYSYKSLLSELSANVLMSILSQEDRVI